MITVAGINPNGRRCLLKKANTKTFDQLTSLGIVSTKASTKKTIKNGSSIDYKRPSSSQRKINSIEKGSDNTMRQPLLKLSKGKNTMKSTKRLGSRKRSEKEFQINVHQYATQQYSINIQSTFEAPNSVSMANCETLNLNKKNVKNSTDENLSTKVSTSSSKLSAESFPFQSQQDLFLFQFDPSSNNDLVGVNNYLQYQYEYLNEIYLNLLLEEGSQEIISQYDYIQKQTDINEQMRAILIDWLIDVHSKFKFTENTLYMTLSIVDKYLSLRYVQRAKLQLLGVSALFLSCKHEEIFVPNIKDFVYVTDNAYVKEEILQMEHDILQAIRFGLLTPSPQIFYEILSLALNFNKKQFYMGKYLMESFMLSYKINKYSSSIISCAAAYVIMKYFKIEKYQICYDKRVFNYKLMDCGVKDCAKDICCQVNHLDTKSNLLAAKTKYATDLYENVSSLNFN